MTCAVLATEEAEGHMRRLANIHLGQRKQARHPLACSSVSLGAALEKPSVWNKKSDSRRDPDAASVGLSCLIKTQSLTKLINAGA